MILIIFVKISQNWVGFHPLYILKQPVFFSLAQMFLKRINSTKVPIAAAPANVPGLVQVYTLEI